MTERSTSQSIIKDIRTRALNKAEVGRSLFFGGFVGGFIGGSEFLVGRFLDFDFGIGLGDSITMGVGSATGNYAYSVFRPEVPKVYKAIVEKMLKKNNSPK